MTYNMTSNSFLYYI